MSMFRRRGRVCVARFEPDEVKVLRKVVTEVIALVSEGFDRGDPVVKRLFPDAYAGPDGPVATGRDIAEAAADFRRYTEGDLKSAKIDQAGAVLAALPSTGGGEVRLDREAAEAWLRALTDARLALAVRLGIRDETDMQEELDDAVLQDPTSQRVFQLSVYWYLGYLQESLVEAISR
ncbi:MAG TPA: DUF2017 domain-containing protein [Micromonosporaceae bacterium]|nr:DUF2017 domain-containing protein [Micromonosporaceae bacterium]